MAFTFFGLIVAAPSEREDPILMNHERIHIEQWKELWLVGFLPLYWGDFIIKWVKYGYEKAYRMSMFEAEALAHENEMFYLKNRKKFAWKEFK